MAKNFNILYERIKEQVYSSAGSALQILAGLNSSVVFKQILQPNGSTNNSVSTSYALQRKKRPSVNTVANAKAGTTGSALAALDQFSEVEWETLPVATGILRSVGFKNLINDELNLALTNAHDDDVKYSIGEVAALRHKEIIKLLQTATKTGRALPAYASGDTKVWEAIAAQVDVLAKVDDAYKDIQALSDFVIVTTNTVARELTKEMGVAFNSEAAIATTGFVSKMQINGTPVIVDGRLAAREVLIFHKESVALKSEIIKKNVSIDLGLNKYDGTYFYDILAKIDPARMSSIKA